MEKEVFEGIELEVVVFAREDVVCASCPFKCEGDNPIVLPDI